MKKVVLFAAALSVSLSGMVMAQGIALKPDEMIAARQAGMSLTGSVAEALKAGVTAGADPKSMEPWAASLVKWGNAFPKLFVAGTESGMNTKALPAVFTDHAGFEKAAATFVAAATKLGDAGKAGDKAAFATAYAELGQSCGGCHRGYRAR